MIRFIIELLLTGVAVAVAAFLSPGVCVACFGWAIWVGLLLALVNATVGFILRVLTLPITVLTLGLFSFVITVLMVLLVDSMMASFETSGFFSAMIFAIILALIKMVFASLSKDAMKKN